MPLAIVGFGLSGYAAFLGIYGVIRYGLFTEGCGAGEVVRRATPVEDRLDRRHPRVGDVALCVRSPRGRDVVLRRLVVRGRSTGPRGRARAHV